jgi:hypothetical protein
MEQIIIFPQWDKCSMTLYDRCKINRRDTTVSPCNAHALAIVYHDGGDARKRTANSDEIIRH